MKPHRSLPAWAPAVLLFSGDAAMILVFTAIGSHEHRLGLGLAGIVTVALPFLLSWTVFALFLGAYRRGAYSRYARAAAAVAAAWIPALPAGLVLRRLMYGKPVFTVFAALALIFVYVFLAAWRLVFTFAARRFAGTLQR